MKRILLFIPLLALLALAAPPDLAAQPKTIDLDWLQWSVTADNTDYETTAAMTASTVDTSEVFTISWFGDNDSTAVLEIWSNDDTTKAKVELQQLQYDPNSTSYIPHRTTVIPLDSLTSGWHTGAKENPQRIPFRFAIPGVGTYRVLVTNGTGVGVDPTNAGDGNITTTPYIDARVKFLK